MAKKFLTLNIGASSVALAEYEANGANLTLLKYGTAALAAPLDSGNADTILSPALLEIVREKGIKPGKVALAVSGQMVFPRFAAIPFAGNDEAKFDQMVRYEVEQNVPFPLDEMVCDRQILGETENGDKSVMIVAAKIDQIESITSSLTGAGFTPTLVDVSPLALVNAFKAAHPEEDGCVVMLDIGAKTTSLAIVEGEKLYNRSIPVAGNTLTKELAQALGCSPEEAEQIKRENAYVSMGGVTEDEDETLDRISKVCRAVMTRLHAEISRSINFYRSQQGGGMPKKLYLTGGTALLPQVDAFFCDSLQIEVEFFNPFEAIGVAPSVDQDALASDAAFLAATAGVALHEAGLSTLKINLLPPSILEARAEVARIPFVAAGAAALVAAGVCVLMMMNNKGAVLQEQLETVEAQSTSLKRVENRIKAAQTAYDETTAEADALKALLMRRSAAALRLNALRQALGNDLWIEKWEKDKVTVRGWKDRIAAFTESASSSGKRLTAPEIVTARLKANAVVDPESVKVTDMSAIGKDGSLEQFVVELKFK